MPSLVVCEGAMKKKKRPRKKGTYYDYDGERHASVRWDYVLFGVGVAAFLICALLAFINDVQESKSRQTLQGLKEMQEIVFATGANGNATDGGNEVEVSYEKIFAKNEDMIGWLQIPGTEIDYPVMQTMEDEEYYLKRDFYGNDDKNGCLLMDTDSDVTKTSNNLIIHGHNMRSGAMFGTLKDYEDEAYEKEHSKILFTTQTETRTYEIVAVIHSKVYTAADQVFKYYNFFEAKTQDEFDYFYDNMKEMSLYDTGVTATFGDEFITLSTCSYHTKNGRLAVIAKRVK